MDNLQFHPFSWDRVEQAVKAVAERRRRAVAALEEAGIPYALIGAIAVQIWVERQDLGGIRNTPNVDILFGANDFEAAKKTLTDAAFVYNCHNDIHKFLDRPSGKPRQAVQVFIADCKIHENYEFPAPSLHESESSPLGRVISLEALARMKLTSFRTVDRVHLRDMIDVGAIDSSWLSRIPTCFVNRLQEILDSPDG